MQIYSLDTLLIVFVSSDGLLNRTTAHPNPDFFIAQLFHDLMGERVLLLNASAHHQGLRSYAQCHHNLGGNATLLLINVSPTVTFSVDIDAAVGTGTSKLGMDVYELSAGDGHKEKWLGLDSQHIMLNGVSLQSMKAGSLPTLAPRRSTQSSLDVKPLTIVFVSVSAVTHCH